MAQDFIFGQTYAADAPASEMSGSVWIRKVPVGTTLLRIFPAYATSKSGEELHGVYAWPWEWEHYDAVIGVSYPCMRKYGQDCRGCASDVERTARRQKFYYFNAIDEQGNLRIYKVGQKVWEMFERRQKKFLAADPSEPQPLSQRNYSIERSGKDLNTVYEVEAGDKYPVEFPEEYPSIPQALADAYNEAMAKYEGATPGSEDDDDIIDDDDEPATGVAGLSKPAAKPLQFGNHSGGANKDGSVKEEAPKEENNPADELADEPTPEDIAHASTPALRAWLERNKVEFPPRAPRSRLMALVSKELEPPF